MQMEHIVHFCLCLRVLSLWVCNFIADGRKNLTNQQNLSLWYHPRCPLVHSFHGYFTEQVQISASFQAMVSKRPEGPVSLDLLCGVISRRPLKNPMSPTVQRTGLRSLTTCPKIWKWTSQELKAFKEFHIIEFKWPFNSPIPQHINKSQWWTFIRVQSQSVTPKPVLHPYGMSSISLL